MRRLDLVWIVIGIVDEDGAYVAALGHEVVVMHINPEVEDRNPLGMLHTPCRGDCGSFAVGTEQFVADVKFTGDKPSSALDPERVLVGRPELLDRRAAGRSDLQDAEMIGDTTINLGDKSGDEAPGVLIAGEYSFANPNVLDGFGPHRGLWGGYVGRQGDGDDLGSGVRDGCSTRAGEQQRGPDGGNGRSDQPGQSSWGRVAVHLPRLTTW